MRICATAQMRCPLDLPENLKSFDTLVEIIAQLRAPDGCPWDKEQTHQSLRGNLLSETYEVMEALDKNEAAELCEELGDLLLQIVLHAQIARDDKEFEIGDVIEGISQKLIRRHPHIFGDVKVSNSTEVMHNWEGIKKKEKPERKSILDGVPKAMPALAYALEISRRAVRVGFEWSDLQGVIDKIQEEVGEIKDAKNQAEKTDEIGDLLFTLVNYARWEGVDPEAALREANQKFYRRFSKVEEMARKKGQDLQKLSLKEWDNLWEEAKRGE
jgi:tetrapyrrole methylase family protein / MazG family protein